MSEQRNADADKKYQCPCGSTLSRSDVLLRHIRKCPQAQETLARSDSSSRRPSRSKTACNECALSRLKCDSKTPCSRCEKKSLRCEYTRKGYSDPYKAFRIPPSKSRADESRPDAPPIQSIGTSGGESYLSGVLETKNFSAMEMKRGIKHFLPKPEEEFDGDYQDPEMTRWYHDLDKYGYGVSIQTIGNRLFREQSNFQRVEIFNTKKYGNMLVLDSKIQTTEGDEFIYHELIAHVPLLTLQNAKRVLIIGGGDGGTAREVLRHENLEEVVMVEIDQVVIDASKKFLPTISSAFDHPKLKLLVDDGINYVKQSADKSFDVVLVDSTDPIGPGVTLFDDEFYKNCHRILTDKGILITQSESPTGAPDEYKELYKKYYRVFGDDNVHCYKCATPTYSTGLWTFSYCTKGNVHPLKDLDEEKVKEFEGKNKLRYYNADIHKAVFALPNYIRKMLNELKSSKFD